MKRFLLFPTSVCVLLFAASSNGQVPDWPELYNPFSLHTLHVQTIAPSDFDVIRADTTYDIEVPAYFWAENEAPVVVSIRRKSASAIPNELAADKKVSYKIDINEYHDDPDGIDVCVGIVDVNSGCVSKWKGVKKLSLENGDDQDVVQEGVAWYLHRLAAESELAYDAGMASWVKLYINGQYQGVYVNVEQPDKQFLKNRQIWELDGDTWLYKMSDIDSPTMKEGVEDEFGVEIDSPLAQEFCFAPFKKKRSCEMPEGFKALLEDNINMEGMLTFGAVSAFHGSHDDLFTKGKNFYYVDQGDGLTYKREYFQWDLDEAFLDFDPNLSIYQMSSDRANQYEDALIKLQDAPFRAEYNAIHSALFNGDSPVFSLMDLNADLDEMRMLLEDALFADSNAKNALQSFDLIQQYFDARIASIKSQLPSPPPDPGVDGEIHVGDMAGFGQSIDRRTWTATARVSIHDYMHTSLSGVTVSGLWGGGVTGNASCTTDSSGVCQVSILVSGKKIKSVAFTVSNLDPSGGESYVSAQNHDDDGNSDGTSINIAKP